MNHEIMEYPVEFLFLYQTLEGITESISWPCSSMLDTTKLDTTNVCVQDYSLAFTGHIQLPETF